MADAAVLKTVEGVLVRVRLPPLAPNIGAVVLMGTHLTCNQVFGVRFPIAPPICRVSVSNKSLCCSWNSLHTLLQFVSVAQLAECLPSKQDVVSSNLITDTISLNSSMAEQSPFKRLVVGSNPTSGTICLICCIIVT